MESVLPLIVVGGGFLVIGFIVGHNKGFSDGFDYAVQNSKEVGNEIAKNMVKEGTLRIYKIEKDGTFNPVEEKPDSVEENS